MSAHLYLIPNTLTSNSTTLPAYATHYAAYLLECSVFFVENIKPARRWIKQITPNIIIDEKIFIEMHHNASDYLSVSEKYFKEGLDIGVISDAGLPCIADPGATLVYQAHQYRYKVVPLVGGSSIFLALMASGLNGQRFAFKGYLPIPMFQRKKTIRKWEQRSREEGETQIFIETPYRNNALFQDLVHTCRLATQLCVACNLTAENAFVQTKNIGAWQQNMLLLPKDPCVFLLYAGE